MRRPDRAVGLSLVEVCAATAVIGVVTAAAVTLVPPWLDDARQTAETTSLVALLRDAQQRAVSEGRALCVDIDVAARTWSVSPRACDRDSDGVTYSADGSATPETFRIGADTVTVHSSGSTTLS